MDQTLIQLDQSESFVHFEFNPDRPVLRPGSYWLMLVETDDQPHHRRFRMNSTTTIPAFSVKWLAEAGPFSKD